MTQFSGFHKPQQIVHILIYSLELVSITIILHNYGITNPGMVCFRIVRIVFSSNDFLKGNPQNVTTTEDGAVKKSLSFQLRHPPNKMPNDYLKELSGLSVT